MCGGHKTLSTSIAAPGVYWLNRLRKVHSRRRLSMSQPNRIVEDVSEAVAHNEFVPDFSGVLPHLLPLVQQLDFSTDLGIDTVLCDPRLYLYHLSVSAVDYIDHIALVGYKKLTSDRTSGDTAHSNYGNADTATF